MLLVERQVVITENFTTTKLADGLAVCDHEVTVMSQDNLYFMGRFVAHSDVEVRREHSSYLMVDEE